MNRKSKAPKPVKQTDPHTLRVGQTLELTITGFDDEGFGIASHERKRVLTNGAFPGETVLARITHCGARTAFAETVKLITPLPSRLTPPQCGNRNCDGCPLIAMAYPAQLDLKKKQVEREMRAYVSLRGATIHDVLPSPRPLEYRNSAKLVVAGSHAAPQIGIYRRNSHQVADISRCPLHHPLINKIVAAVKSGITKGKVPVYNPKTGNGILRYLVVRVSETGNRAMVVFVTAYRSFNELHHLAKYLREAVPEVDVVAQNVNPSEGNVILGTQQEHFLTRQHTIEETLGTVRFAISPRSFFQVNSGGAKIIYDRVRQWASLTGNETVVDLYCGIGGISLFLASGAQEVLGIEVVDSAVADAEKNARLNRIGNCSFEAGDAAELLEEYREEGKRVDLLILNPPRKGCDRRVLETAAALSPARIIYVSCSPSTLARDLDILAAMGYATRQVQPVDMFPQTPHVENVALIEKGEATLKEHRPIPSPGKKPLRPLKKKRGGA